MATRHQPYFCLLYTSFIGDYPIVAHNAIFDYTFINEASIRTTGKEIKNARVDSQQMFKEVYPDLDSHGLDALTKKFNVDLTNHHRACLLYTSHHMVDEELKTELFLHLKFQALPGFYL